MSSAQETLARRLRTQARSCAELGSPLYSDLMQRAAADVEAGGPVFEVLAGHADDPGPSAIALRLFGGVHRLALEGRAPDLASYYPSCAGPGVAATGDAWPAFLATVTVHKDELRAGLHQAPQTNEVGRSAALMPGFVTIAAETGLPLRLLELGASAGLNLRWDRYRYELTDPPLGDPTSAVRFPGSWYDGGTRDLAKAPWPQVVDRQGCDGSPLDPTTEEGR